MSTLTAVMSGLDTFEELESEVRSYVRSWPAVWSRAQGATLWDEHGREYLDFFSGAGGLNYGHNDDAMIDALVRYPVAGCNPLAGYGDHGQA